MYKVIKGKKQNHLTLSVFHLLMVEEIKKKMTNASLQEKCIALKEAMKISQEEADLVSKFTREQSEDPKWKEYRIGRITASKAHDVIVKYNADMTVKN